jgi:hypothetical protein
VAIRLPENTIATAGNGGETQNFKAGNLLVSSVPAGSVPAAVPSDPAVYRPSAVKRARRTDVQLADIDDVILQVLLDEHPATLRGTFYRVMSAGAVAKSEAGYKLVGRQVLKLRRSRDLPYSWITDGTRYFVKPDSWNDLDEMLEDAAASYRRMLWRDQDINVQMFTEKDAITGVISGVTAEWDVPLGVLRGYCSESFAWSVAETLSRRKPTVMYQLGDHDPSGVDAWRNFAEKVAAFAPDAEVTFQRLAVLPEQIYTLDLPTRPTKRTDSRSAGFVGESVEVDAIAPSKLRAIVRNAIEKYIDPAALALTRSVEASERDTLTEIIGGAR